MSALASIVNCAITLPLEITQVTLGYSSSLLLSFTINQLLVVCILLPLYLIKVAFRVLPFAIGNFRHILYARGRAMLIRTTVFHRKKEEQQAQLQFEGRFGFPKRTIFPVKRIRKEWMNVMPWQDETEEFRVCGVMARFVHLKPAVDGDSGNKKRKIVLLHGNPSWSYEWRNVLPSLVRQGHEVYALDWLGYGRSDKISRGGLINFELHMRTLISFFDHTKLENAVVVGHDWGGCIALCTIPYLPARACDGIFLINTFLPPRFGENSVFNVLFYLIWYSLTGLLDGFLPPSVIVRFLAPHLSLRDIKGYVAPYQGLPASAECVIQRFTHIVPILPRYVLRFARETLLWKLIEGFLGPENFTNINAQARLAAIDEKTRDFWDSRRPDRLNQGTENGFKVAVAFGDRDPLLKDYMHIFPETINRRYMTDCVWWLKRAGHYPMEERPYEVANLIRKLADG